MYWGDLMISRCGIMLHEWDIACKVHTVRYIIGQRRWFCGMKEKERERERERESWRGKDKITLKCFLNK